MKKLLCILMTCLIFSFSCAEASFASENETATITVSEDTYTRSGANQYAVQGNNMLVVDSSRTTYLKFNVTELKTAMNGKDAKYKLQFTSHNTENKTTGTIYVYGISGENRTGWSDSSLTHNLALTNGLHEDTNNLLGEVYVSGKNVTFTVDVTDYILSIPEDGIATLKIQNNVANAPVIVLQSSESAVSDAAKPMLIAERTYAEGTKAVFDNINIPTGATERINLPESGAVYGSSISWISSQPQIISTDGTVTRQNGEAVVTLTAIDNDYSDNRKSFDVVVPAAGTETKAVIDSIEDTFTRSGANQYAVQGTNMLVVDSSRTTYLKFNASELKTAMNGKDAKYTLQFTSHNTENKAEGTVYVYGISGTNRTGWSDSSLTHNLALTNGLHEDTNNLLGEVYVSGKNVTFTVDVTDYILSIPEDGIATLKIQNNVANAPVIVLQSSESAVSDAAKPKLIAERTYTDDYTGGINPKIYINGKTATSLGEGVVTARVAFVNDNVTTSPKGTLILALYNGEIFEEMKSVSLDFSDEFVNDMSVSLDVPYGDDYRVKAFLFSGFDTLVPLTEVNLLDAVASDAEMTIACWGDSLTFGQGSSGAFSTGANSYPSKLAKLTGETVYNMGVGGETSMTIAARQGVVDMVLTEDFVIPESGSVNIPLASTVMDGNTVYYIATQDDGKVVPRVPEYGMWNPVTINGVEGTLSVEINTITSRRMLNSATFTRKQVGEAVAVVAGTKLKTAASKVKADINVFFTGTNGGWNTDNTNAVDSEESVADLIALINKQIAATKDPSKYIVIGLTHGDKDQWQYTNPALKATFGEHFIDAKAYLATEQALIDAGITPTEQDMTDLASGTIPTSLRSDAVHFNNAGYELLANLVYEKLNELGYLCNTQICDVKDNKKAIWTFTSDDSLTTSCEYFCNEFQKNDLRGSLAMVVNTFYNDDGSLNSEKVNAFKDIFATGRFDITNHTYNHTDPRLNYGEEGYIEYWENEIDGAQKWFEDTFDGERVFTVANPLVVTKPEVNEIIKVNNWAARNGKIGANNSLNPTEDEWFHLRWQHGNSDCTVETMKEWIDSVIEERKWQIELWHGVDGEGSSPVASNIATPYFKYVASKKDDLWIATFNEAVQYLREKQNAQLEINVKDNENIEVRISHNLPQDIFNYPLSVRTRVPADWETAKITQGNKVKTVNVKSRHILYDVVPDGSTVLIEKAN